MQAVRSDRDQVCEQFVKDNFGEKSDKVESGELKAIEFIFKKAFDESVFLLIEGKQKRPPPIPPSTIPS